MTESWEADNERRLTSSLIAENELLRAALAHIRDGSVGPASRLAREALHDADIIRSQAALLKGRSGP